MKMELKSRNYNDLDMSELFQDLENELDDNFPSDSNCSDLVGYHEESVTRILDKHWRMFPFHIPGSLQN